MGKNKISLSFVNDGKEFVPPHMTVKGQEELLKDLVELEGTHEKDSDEYNRESHKYMILRCLQTIDKSITLEDINNMHPDDFMYLFELIWNSGRELKRDDGNFR